MKFKCLSNKISIEAYAIASFNTAMLLYSYLKLTLDNHNKHTFFMLDLGLFMKIKTLEFNIGDALSVFKHCFNQFMT